jgi:hypothetical protein
MLLGINPPNTAYADVWRRIRELVKYILNQQDGRTTLTALAEAVAQPERTLRLALDYTAAQGEITVEYRRGGGIVIAPPSVKSDASDTTPDLLAALQTSIAETAAYRAYFRRANPEHLLGPDLE